MSKATPIHSSIGISGAANVHLGRVGAKVVAETGLDQAVAAMRQQGRRIGFTNGCFDIVHVGHVAVLEFARAACDALVIGVNSDASVKRLKGSARPINSEQDRALVLAALQAADLVCIFEDDTPLELIRRIRPDVLVKGGDYTLAQIVGAEDVIAWGGEVLTCPIVAGKSTTATVAAIGTLVGHDG